MITKVLVRPSRSDRKPTCHPEELESETWRFSNRHLDVWAQGEPRIRAKSLDDDVP